MEEVEGERVGDIGIDRAPPARGHQDLSPHFACLREKKCHMTFLSTACKGRGGGSARLQAERRISAHMFPALQKHLSPHFACLQKTRAEMTFRCTACKGSAGLARCRAVRWGGGLRACLVSPPCSVDSSRSPGGPISWGPYSCRRGGGGGLETGPIPGTHMADVE